MFRADDSNTLKKDKDYKIDGSVVNITLIKSRTNATKKSIPLIFNKTDGRFDEILSLFHLIKSEGLFKGAGAFLYLDECPNIKFSASSFKETLENSEELQSAFAKVAYKLLSEFLSDTRAVSEDNSRAASNISNMFDKFSMGEF